MNQGIINKANEIINANTFDAGGWGKGYCTLALIDELGFPTASTISAAKSDGINWLTFAVLGDSNKVKRVQKDNRASVCINSQNFNITLVGTAEILTDPKIKEEMWYTGCEHHFAGVDDPNYAVLRFVTKRYNIFINEQHVVGEL